MADAVVTHEAAAQTKVVAGEGVELAQWYWVRQDDDDEDWFACVTHIGSNYIEMTSINEGTARIHADVFHDQCRGEFNPTGVIERNTTAKRGRVRQLMEEVSALTARLGVGDTAAITSGSEGHALARLDPSQDVNQYKTDLIKAKEESLPALFKDIEETNEELAMWMRAETLPMKAQLDLMKGAIDHIDDRIFNVELYAGLTEKVAQIADGQPAAMGEKIRLMQRRCYMDEECLAHYETGGMDFDDISDFDAWLARPANRDRILPFPRCVVAFRVRRNTKHRECRNFIDFFSIIDKIQADKLTFLYLRNGDRLYRINTKLEFGEQLFPDTEHHHLTSGAKLWGRTFSRESDDIITDAQYQGLREKHSARVAKDKKQTAEHKVKLKAWKAAKRAAKKAGQDFNEREPWFFSSWDSDPTDEYEPFEPNNIYYDDLQKKLADEVQQYNRIGIIIQGLLDRSPVFHPHPPWKIWSEDGFGQALEMIYDASRALSADEKPDFEAYRKQLNKSLKTGSVTVGHRTVWTKIQDAKNDRAEHFRRYRIHRHGDPGPGELARIEKYHPRSERCAYAWHRDGESYVSYDKKFRVKFVCNAKHVLNVDAYKPGDFRKFFSDPRTRAEYLQWASLLLTAEEYHAGNRSADTPPPPAPRDT